MMRLVLAICLYLLLCLAPLQTLAESLDESAQLESLQQENAELQLQIKRLEAREAALREELNRPGMDRIVAGVGYIVGIFGGVAWIAARRNRRED